MKNKQKWFNVYNNLHETYSILIEETKSLPEVKVVPKINVDITEEEQKFIEEITMLNKKNLKSV